MTKKYYYLTFFLLFFSSLFANETERPIILVSIPPYKEVIEKIVKDTADVVVIVPSGASPHMFEPTLKQSLKLSRAAVWFRSGEGFEKKLLSVLKHQNPKLKAVDLRQGLDLIKTSGHQHSGCHHEDCIDPHTWLSPKLVQKQAVNINKTLTEMYPEYKEFYNKNMEKLYTELELLNNDIKLELAPLKNRTIMVSHPAYAYFCRDFNLKQLSIEFEGKEPSTAQVGQILAEAKKHSIHTIFIQKQHRGKGAELIAKQINAKIVSLDPLAPNYFNNMRYIAKNFAGKN